jgi:hypothetical protein
MSIRSNSKLKKLQALGKIVRAALDEMSEAVAPVSLPENWIRSAQPSWESKAWKRRRLRSGKCGFAGLA